MRSQERRRGLLRAPRLAWDILLRGRYRFTYDQMSLESRGMMLAKRVNLFRAGANLLYRKFSPWSMPLHMQLELTNYCNLRCPICPTGVRAVKRPPQAMDARLFERVMDSAGRYLLTASLWAWGEPLLHPQLNEILRAARRQAVITLLSTNGQCLNQDRVINALVSNPPNYLILAIDGITDQTNSGYRVGAKLAPALEGIRRLAQIKRERGLRQPVLNMRYIVMKHNQHELPLLDDFARSHGFELLTIRHLFFVDSTTKPEAREKLAPDADIWKQCGHEHGGNAARKGFICQEPFWFPTVLADGTLVLCEQDYNAEMALGRISENVSFSDLWYSPRAVQLRRMIRDHMEDVSFCRKCPYIDRPTTGFNIEARYLSFAGCETKPANGN